jgi:hypothetical protein
MFEVVNLRHQTLYFNIFILISLALTTFQSSSAKFHPIAVKPQPLRSLHFALPKFYTESSHGPFPHLTSTPCRPPSTHFTSTLTCEQCPGRRHDTLALGGASNGVGCLKPTPVPRQAPCPSPLDQGVVSLGGHAREGRIRSYMHGPTGGKGYRPSSKRRIRNEKERGAFAIFAFLTIKGKKGTGGTEMGLCQG